MRAKEGLNQRIRLKFCSQGRGISLASINYFYNLLDSSESLFGCISSREKSHTVYVRFTSCILIYLFAHASPTFLEGDKVGIGGD